jgi:hypothetical protein
MRSVFLLAAVSLATAFPVLAQEDLPKCDGSVATVRVSDVKPGQMQGFLAAVAAHKAWYRSHGFSDNVIVTSRVIVRDEKTKAMQYSDTEMVSYHVNPPSREATMPKHDAAWDAYVKQYRDTSEIKSEYLTCMPKLAP